MQTTDMLHFIYLGSVSILCYDNDVLMVWFMAQKTPFVKVRKRSGLQLPDCAATKMAGNWSDESSNICFAEM